MNESTIRELLSRLFDLSYEENDKIIGRYNHRVISQKDFQLAENTVRQWALEFHDNRTGTLEAKVFVYEQIIKNSNFAPMLPNIPNGNNIRGGDIFEDKTESGLLEE